MTNVFGPIISSYSRQNAIDDGALADLMQVDTATGEDYGKIVREYLKIPVAMTAAAFSDALWPIGNEAADAWLESKGETYVGRLRKLCEAIRWRAMANPGKDTVWVRLTVQDWEKQREEIVTLKVVIGPGDRGETVITAMLPNED